jgi:hypothetical protein
MLRQAEGGDRQAKTPPSQQPFVAASKYEVQPLLNFAGNASWTFLRMQIRQTDLGRRRTVAARAVL